MKWIPRILVPVILLLVFPRQSFASVLISFTSVSNEWAEKELGMTTMVNPLDTNLITVSFQFSPTDKLAGFNYVRLKIYSKLYETSAARGEIGRLLTSSELQPLVRTKEKVIVSFWIDRAYLNKREIEIVLFNDPDYHEHSSPDVDGHGYSLRFRR